MYLIWHYFMALSLVGCSITSAVGWRYFMAIYVLGSRRSIQFLLPRTCEALCLHRHRVFVRRVNSPKRPNRQTTGPNKIKWNTKTKSNLRAFHLLAANNTFCARLRAFFHFNQLLVPTHQPVRRCPYNIGLDKRLSVSFEWNVQNAHIIISYL